MLAKVKDNEQLARDNNSRAIINTDSNALYKAKEAKRLIMQRIENEKKLENRVEELESKLQLILSRLDNNG